METTLLRSIEGVNTMWSFDIAYVKIGSSRSAYSMYNVVTLPSYDSP